MSALKKGRLSETDIDRKCRKILSFKYALGLSSWKKWKKKDLQKNW